jgi:hypothetical protein
MPSKSKAQRNLMAAAAHNPAFAKKVGVPMSVAKEFNKADKGKKFGSGGALKAVDSSDNPGLSKLPMEVRNKMGYMKKGGMAKKGMKEGGMMDVAQDKAMIKKALKQHDEQEHKGGKGTKLSLKKGGVLEKGTGEKYASKSAMMKHEKKESKTEETKEYGMKKGGMAKGCGYVSGGKVSQLAKANGIAIKGKSKGRNV